MKKTEKTILYILLLISLISCGQEEKKEEVALDTQNHKHTNQLLNESSPYLLQHAHNPVNWHPWNEKTLAKAKKENKLIIISVGYAACHWCHVMEHESFEDEEVANFMNENFISIKMSWQIILRVENDFEKKELAKRRRFRFRKYRGKLYSEK